MILSVRECDLLFIKCALGHCGVTTIEIYIHLSNDSFEDALEKLCFFMKLCVTSALHCGILKLEVMHNVNQMLSI